MTAPHPGDPNATHVSHLDSAPADTADPGTVDDVHGSGTDDAVPETLEQARKLRSENKNLRARLHTAETEREAAITRLAAADRREAEHIAAQHLIDPKDLWSVQPDSAAFLDDEFQSVVADKVVATAKELIAQKPHLAKPPTAPPPTDRPIEGLRPGARAPENVPAPSWASAIRGTGG